MNEYDLAEKLHELWIARPFVPFTVVLSDTRKFVIDRPERMHLLADGEIMFFFDRFGGCYLVRTSTAREVLPQ